MPEVTAILVNYNAGGELALALQSIRDDCADIAWEAVIVDNASTDGSAAVVETIPQATLVRNVANVGFGRAVNQAVALAKSPLLLLINPDCRVIPGAVSTLRSVLDVEPSCAVVGPRILDPDGVSAGQCARRSRHAHRTVWSHRRASCPAALSSRRPAQRGGRGRRSNRRLQRRRGLAVRCLHARAPGRLPRGRRIRRTLFSVLGGRRPVPQAA